MSQELGNEEQGRVKTIPSFNPQPIKIKIHQNSILIFSIQLVFNFRRRASSNLKYVIWNNTSGNPYAASTLFTAASFHCHIQYDLGILQIH